MENDINLQVTIQEANMLVWALSKQPYEQVAGLINKIRVQAQTQQERTESAK